MVKMGKQTYKDEATGLTLFPQLTDRQLKLLRFIEIFVTKQQMYPTQREIADKFGYSQAAAGQYVMALVKKGYLARDPNFDRRNIRLTHLAIEKLNEEQMQVEL